MQEEFIIKDNQDYFDILAEHFNGLEKDADWEQRISIPGRLGRGAIRRLQIKRGLEMIVSDFELEKNMKLHVKDPCGVFELNYCLSGEIFCDWGDNRHLHVKKQSGNVCYVEHAQVYLEKQSGVRNHTLEIRILPQILGEYFSNPQDRKVLESVLRYHYRRIEPYHISPAMQKCVYEIASCPHGGSAKRIYLHGKVLELLSMFLQEHVGGYKPTPVNLHLSEDDALKLHEARKFVLRHLDDPFSIKELARHVGINQTKLKNGFRELFGTTIFGLIRSQRMEQAVRLMKIDRMNVTETASMLGYSNISNFASAFRKKFGCNPSAYLNSLKKDYGSRTDDIK